MKFKLRQMEIFRAVMITGTISGAARMLFISQPAVSKLLSHTETNLRLKLFHRSKGKLIPTPEAHNLFNEVNQVYEAALKVDAFAENLSANPSGKVHICCSPSLGLDVVPSVLQLFSEKYPDTKIHFHTTLIQDIPLELLSRKSDIAISVLPVEHPNLAVETLIRGKMVCAVPQTHPFASRPEISLHDLQNQKLILYSRQIPFGQLLNVSAEKHGVAFSPIIEVPRAELACSLVSKNVGIAIVDQFSVGNQLWRNLVVRPLAEEISIRVSLIESKFDNPSTEATKFKTILKRYLKQTYASN